MYDAILFDLDGTLTDSGTGITNSVIYSLKKYGIEVPSREELYGFIGPPLHESYRNFFGFSEQKAGEAVGYYREYYKERGMFEYEVYEGTQALLEALRAAKKTLLVATSKPEAFAREILSHAGLSNYFSYIAGANLDGSRTKKEEVIAYALRQAGGAGANCAVMVGDREHDVIGAKKNGMAAIGVLYGYGTREELCAAGADGIAADPLDLLPLLSV